MLPKQKASRLQQVLAPKVSGGAALLAGGSHMPLQTLLFSSVASLVGAAGQANYVAANAVLDGWAGKLEGQGRVCASVQWGAWATAGEALDSVYGVRTSIDL
jgi:hypothetical protein